MKTFFSRIILDYFRFFAQLQLKKNPHSTLIGITGSAGKTSTRRALVQILSTHATVKQSLHANSQSGISLNILGLSPISYSLFDWLRLAVLAPWRYLTWREHYDYYVIEMGIDGPNKPRNMAYLLSIVRPHVAIILGASLAHSGNFDHLVKDTSPLRRPQKLINLIAKEKMQLATGISSSGVAVINLDQPEFARLRHDVSARQLTFGRSPGADLCITSTGISSRGFVLHFRYQKQAYELKLPDVYPDHYAYTFAAAITAASALGIPPTISLPALSTYRSPAGRFRLFSGLAGSTILDSTYNANPVSTLESLKLLKLLGSVHKKIAVIGDLRELGSASKSVHKQLADALELYADEVILFGQSTREHTLPVLLSQKFPVHHFATMIELIEYLKGAIKPKSYILVKGSQNQIFLERAVAAILADSRDTARLCRRGPYWDKIRAHTL